MTVRTLSLILNFVISPNINYRKITGLRREPTIGLSAYTTATWSFQHVISLEVVRHREVDLKLLIAAIERLFQGGI